MKRCPIKIPVVCQNHFGGGGLAIVVGRRCNGRIRRVVRRGERVEQGWIGGRSVWPSQKIQSSGNQKHPAKQRENKHATSRYHLKRPLIKSITSFLGGFRMSQAIMARRCRCNRNVTRRGSFSKIGGCRNEGAAEFTELSHTFPAKCCTKLAANSLNRTDDHI